MTPPIIAATRTTPTTTPAAIAALFEPPDPDDLGEDVAAAAFPGAVTTMVCPASVTTEGACVLVVVGTDVAVLEIKDEDDEALDPSKLATESSVPVKETDQAFGPPPEKD